MARLIALTLGAYCGCVIVFVLAVRVDSAEGLEAAAARLARTVDRPRGARVVT